MDDFQPESDRVLDGRPVITRRVASIQKTLVYQGADRLRRAGYRRRRSRDQCSTPTSTRARSSVPRTPGQN